ncbi:IS481 family transposase [Nakamurella sp. YIM 132087]|uniref:IS481 family transposase n=1 Tax=Nakamurella alba TaxID=2665158 RepID=A0A7K1FMS6_9ACTN|nr:IS481 family transposase [Nakamurella alba]
MIVGYARCSTDEQDLTAQRQQLVALGVAPDRIYVDQGLTHTTRSRPGLREALAAVQAGDTLAVTKLDRLARSVTDARAIADELVARQVALSLGGTLHDPTDPVKRQIVALRWRHRLGPVQIAGKLQLPASTVDAVLLRCRISRLRQIDRVVCEPIRRYEHDAPGAMLHVDVTKFGSVPDGGGHRFVGRQQGEKNRSATAERTGNRNHRGEPRTGVNYVHTVIDDRSRVAYAEIPGNEKSSTAVDVLRNAVAWFADRGIQTQRVLSDNGSCYRSFLWRDTCAELEITAKRTRPYRPQTNGKIEGFHRTLADGWAYARRYQSDGERRAALPSLIHFYNHHRLHTAIGNQPPISLLTNLPVQYT